MFFRNDHAKMIAVMMAAATLLCAGCASKEPAADTEGTTTNVAVTTTTTAPVTMETKIGRCTATDYIVRDEPSLDASSPGGLLKDEEVVILGREGDWFKIQYGDGIGYVNAQYITIISDPTTTLPVRTTLATTTKATTTVPTTAPTQIGRVEADEEIVVRGEPNEDAESVGNLPAGEEIVIIDQNGDWYEVEIDGNKGYVNVEDITIVTTTTKKGETTTTKKGETTTTKKGETTTKAGNNGTKTTASGGNAAVTTTTSVQTDNVEFEFEDIPGTVVIDQWD